ncbi:MAG: hypothetical protein KAS16_06695 [Thermoplasmata archaeon]|nr:hypothetical protein [Thermoplasmata archaeon]
MKLVWKYTTGNSINFISAIEKSNNIVFCADQDVYCIDNLRNVKWKYETGNFINHFDISSDGANVFISTDDEIISLTRIGHLNWKIPTPVPVSSIILSNNQDRVIIGFKDGKIITLNLSGEEIWSVGTEANIQKLLVNQHGITSLGKDGAIHDISLDGTLKKVFDQAEIIDILATDDLIFTISKDGTIQKVVNGKPSWKKKVKSKPTNSQLCLDFKCITISCMDGRVFSFTYDGKVKSHTKVDGGVSFMKKLGSHMIIATDNNIVYAMDNDLKPAYTLKINDWINDITYFRGQLLIGAADTTLYAFSSKEESERADEEEVDDMPPEMEIPGVDEDEIEINFKLPHVDEKDILEKTYKHILDKKMVYSKREIQNILYSLKSQPFMILSGKPGLGKTRVALEIIDAFKSSIFNDELIVDIFISVHHGFDESDLWGYVNLNDDFVPSSLSKQLFFNGSRLKTEEEIQNDERIYFIILDEMNLSQPDYYLTKLLSAIENKKPIPLPSGKNKKEIIHMPLPINTFVIGTINSYVEDATREKLSGGLKRRANIVFVSNPLDSIFKINDVEKQKRQLKSIILTLIKQIQQDNDMNAMMGKYRMDSLNSIEGDEINRTVISLFNILKIMQNREETKLTLGVIQDMVEYMLFSTELDSNTAIDYQILQKIIPQITGEIGIVDELLSIDNFIKIYPRTSALLMKMKKEAAENMNIIVSPI